MRSTRPDSSGNGGASGRASAHAEIACRIMSTRGSRSAVRRPTAASRFGCSNVAIWLVPRACAAHAARRAGPGWPVDWAPVRSASPSACCFRRRGALGQASDPRNPCRAHSSNGRHSTQVCRVVCAISLFGKSVRRSLRLVELRHSVIGIGYQSDPRPPRFSIRVEAIVPLLSQSDSVGYSRSPTASRAASLFR